jgi:hypothetical protein
MEWAFASWIKEKYCAENLFISTSSSSLFLEYGYSSKHFPSHIERLSFFC